MWPSRLASQTGVSICLGLVLGAEIFVKRHLLKFVHLLRGLIDPLLVFFGESHQDRMFRANYFLFGPTSPVLLCVRKRTRDFNGQLLPLPQDSVHRKTRKGRHGWTFEEEIKLALPVG